MRTQESVQKRLKSTTISAVFVRRSNQFFHFLNHIFNRKTVIAENVFGGCACAEFIKTEFFFCLYILRNAFRRIPTILQFPQNHDLPAVM